MALGLQDGSAVVINAASDSSSECWQLHDLGSQRVCTVAWQDETVLYTGSEEGAVSIRMPEREAVRRVRIGEGAPQNKSDKLHSDEVRSVTWSTDGVYLSSGSEDKTARIITAETLATPSAVSKHKLPVYSTAWDPKNAAVVCGLDGELQVVGTDNTVLFSSVGLKRGKKKPNRNPHTNDIYALAWKPDGSALVTGDYDGFLGIWYRCPSEVKPLLSKEKKRDLGESEYFNKSEYFRVSTCADDDYDPQHSDSILGIAFAPDGEHFATASWDSDIRIFNFSKKEQIIHLDTVHEEAVASLAWASKGDRTLLATGSRGEAATICILDVDIKQQKSEQLRRLKIHDRAVHAISWSKDAQRLATGGADAVVNIVDTAPDNMDEWRVIWKVDSTQMDISPRLEIRSVAWSPVECTELAIGTSGGDVRVMGTYSPFVNLVGFLADCRQQKKNKMAGSVLECCHQVKYAAALPGNCFAAPTELGKLVLPKGWTVFHELASGSKKARKTFWANPAYAFPNGCFVPTKLDSSTTADDLKKAGLSLNYDKELPFTDLTALDIVILQQDVQGVKHLLSKLSPDMELVFTANVTRSLVLLSEHLPYHISSALEILEKGYMKGEEEVNGQSEGVFLTMKTIDKLSRPLEGTGEVRGSADAECTLWQSFQHDTEADNRVECACKLQLLRLGNIAGQPSKSSDWLEDSPYHKLIENCPEHLRDELFESRTITVLTQFKWEAFARKILHYQLIFYYSHCAIAAAALLWTTQHIDTLTAGGGSSEGDGSNDVGSLEVADGWFATALITGVATTNTFVLINELSDIWLEGALEYFKSAWNLLDAGGLVSLYISVGAFATGNLSVLTYSGALGVFFNSFSILQLLRPFEGTGPVIKVTTSILQNDDIKGFLCVSMLLLVGFTAGFAVSMPESLIFGFHDVSGGPFHGLLIVFQSMLGAFDVEHYQHPVAVLMFPVFAFIMVLVMLNLLVAMMTDSYTAVKEQAVKEVQKLRAEVIINIEQRLFTWQRTSERFPKYLQVLVPEERRAAFAATTDEERLDKMERNIQQLQKKEDAHLRKLDELLEAIREIQMQT